MTGSIDRALVLGGGGPVGIAWQVGLVAGLKEAGLEVMAADRVLGTSAGAFVGAQLALGVEPGLLAQLHLAAAGQGQQGSGESLNEATLLAEFVTSIAPGEVPSEAQLADFGRAALEMKTMPEADFLARFSGMFPPGPWPERFGCAAVNARTGVIKVWSAADGVPIELAVPSSCSLPTVYPPITIDGAPWVDGGIRSWNNADLVAGARRVLIVAVLTPQWEPVMRPALAREMAAIEAAGGTTALVVPDPSCLDVFGADLLSATQSPHVIPAGIAQGRREAERLEPLWR